jgi:hypothetical protein
MQQLRMLLVPAYRVTFTDEQVPNLVVPYSHPLHDKMDVLARVIDFLLAKESTCQS